MNQRKKDIVKDFGHGFYVHFNKNYHQYINYGFFVKKILHLIVMI